MSKILKNNQVIITALAIMIAIAGYLNFSDTSTEEQQYGEIYEAMEDTNEKNIAGTEDKKESGDLVDAENFTDIEDVDKQALAEDDKSKEEDKSKEDDAVQSSTEDVSDEENTDTNKEDKKADAKESDASSIGEAVLVNSSISLNYFYTVKLDREQLRARSQENLMKIVDSTTVSEEQKQSAINEIIQLTSNAEMENAAEILLEAKGFANAVVSMVDGSVDVVIDSKSLTDEQVAQIQDVVKRKTGVETSKIVITPVNSEEVKNEETKSKDTDSKDTKKEDTSKEE